jgi:hypothetical protein
MLKEELVLVLLGQAGTFDWQLGVLHLLLKAKW